MEELLHDAHLIESPLVLLFDKKAIELTAIGFLELSAVSPCDSLYTVRESQAADDDMSRGYILQSRVTLRVVPIYTPGV